MYLYNPNGTAKIVDPDPGKNYNAAIFAGDPHFEMEKEIYLAAVRIVARLQIVMLDARPYVMKKYKEPSEMKKKKKTL